jgi:hypothetical protein
VTIAFSRQVDTFNTQMNETKTKHDAELSDWNRQKSKLENEIAGLNANVTFKETELSEIKIFSFNKRLTSSQAKQKTFFPTKTNRPDLTNYVRVGFLMVSLCFCECFWDTKVLQQSSNEQIFFQISSEPAFTIEQKNIAVDFHECLTDL